MYRFEWATILVELIIVLGLMFTLTSELQPLHLSAVAVNLKLLEHCEHVCINWVFVH